MAVVAIDAGLIVRLERTNNRQLADRSTVPDRMVILYEKEGIGQS